MGIDENSDKLADQQWVLHHTCHRVALMLDMHSCHASMWMIHRYFFILLLLLLMMPTDQPNINGGVAVALQHNPAQRT